MAHNIGFERRHLNGVFEKFDIDARVRDYLCSMHSSKAFSGDALLNNQLKTVFKAFTGKELMNHHNALVDALACAEIMIKLITEKIPSVPLDFDSFADDIHESNGKNRIKYAQKPRISDIGIDPGYENEKYLAGRCFCITGGVGAITQYDLYQTIVNLGGKLTKGVTKSTTDLIVGHYGAQYGPDYKSEKHAKV